jgi:glycine dehydrogenase subunit 1
MDVTNASMYEGGSALAEAMLLACGHTRRNRVLVAGGVNRRYRMIMETYILHNEIELVDLPLENFRLDPGNLESLLNDQVAALILQHPNYFGYLEEVFELEPLVHKNGSLLLSCYDPVSLGLIAPPGTYHADIAVAEGQVLGNRQNLGGPYVGLFSATQELIRKMPGRLSGKTTDLDGKEGFVLTLQTREQHIRREKATSNICTNSGLMALAATVYLALMGPDGLQETANLCLQKSHYLAENLGKIKGVAVYDNISFFKEFVVKLPAPVDKILGSMKSEGFFAGIHLDKMGFADHLLVSVTEKRTREEMDRYAVIMEKLVGQD